MSMTTESDNIDLFSHDELILPLLALNNAEAFDGTDFADSSIKEISNIKVYANTLEEELLSFEKRTWLQTPRRVITLDDDDGTEEESVVLRNEEAYSALYLDIKNQIASVSTSQNSLVLRDSDRGFTPMTISQLFEVETPNSGVSSFLQVLKEARGRSVLSVQRLSGEPELERDFLSSALSNSIYDEDEFYSETISDKRSENTTTSSSTRIFDKSPNAKIMASISQDAMRRNWDIDDDPDAEFDLFSSSYEVMRKSKRYSEEFKSSLCEPIEKNSDINPAWNDEILIEAGLQAVREIDMAKDLPDSKSPARESILISTDKHTSNNNFDDIDLSPSRRRLHIDPYIDERVRADFSVWQEGPKLTWPGLKEAYVGLFDSIINSSANLDCVSVMECVIRPDVELKRPMAAVLRIAHNRNCKFILSKRSQALITRDIYSSSPSTQAVINSTLTVLSSPSLLVPQIEEEWNTIEFQICISKDLRQRVLLCIFLREKTSAMMRLSPRNTSSTLPIYLMTSSIQRVLASSRICLSSLFTSSAETVCHNNRLDGHFTAQAQTLLRESMWANLHEAFLAMDDYVKHVESSTAIFEQGIKPIIKQHAIDMPVLPRPKLKVKVIEAASPAPSEDSIRDSNSFPNRVFANGMVKCLTLVSEHFLKLQAKFDLEFSQRLQRKHDSVFQYIDELVAYRQNHLLAIARSSQAKISQLTQAYQSAMMGVAASTNAQKPESLASSWLASLAGPAPTSSINHRNIYSQDETFSENSPMAKNNVRSLKKPSQSIVKDQCEETSSRLQIGNNRKNHIEDASPSFRPFSDQAKLTAEKVKERLATFRKSLDGEFKSSVLRNKLPYLEKKGDNECLSDVVLFYCASLVGGSPGTLYLTPLYISLSFGWAVTQQRERLPLCFLTSITLQPPTQPYLPSNTLKISFFDGKREVFVTPMAVEASRVRLIISDAVAAFSKS